MTNLIEISVITEEGKEITGYALHCQVDSYPDKMIDCTCYGDQHKRYVPGPTITTKLYVSLSERSSEILSYLTTLMMSRYQNRKINIKLKDKEGNIIIGYGSVMEIKGDHIVFLMDSLPKWDFSLSSKM